VRIRSFAAAAVVVLALALTSCGSSGGSDSTGTTSAKATSTTSAKADETLTILVSNDDGYSAPGIDAVVEALRKLPHVHVDVVAPATDESGTGGKTTPGTLKTQRLKTQSGYPAVAVAGFPADAVNVAFDELDLKPDVVVTGINRGQNVGAAVNVSGTVGAARAAAVHGVAALASSQGGGSELDYPSGVEFVVDWVKEHRAALVAGKAPLQVENLNVPTCVDSEVRGLAEVPYDTSGDLGAALKNGDCRSTAPLSSLHTDVEAFQAGYATLTVIPIKAE
jgi:5'-nucleotidase